MELSCQNLRNSGAGPQPGSALMGLMSGRRCVLSVFVTLHVEELAHKELHVIAESCSENLLQHFVNGSYSEVVHPFKRLPCFSFCLFLAAELFVSAEDLIISPFIFSPQIGRVIFLVWHQTVMVVLLYISARTFILPPISCL